MDFKLPDIGEGVHEGEIVKWLVNEGQDIDLDQPMVEVMTDKATVEIPSPIRGKVSKIFAQAGETIEVGKVIVQLSENGAAAEAPAAETKPEAPVKSQAPAPKVAAQPKWEAEEEVLPFKVLATPATRKLARELEIDLRTIKGTGDHGRVTKVDVQMAYEGGVAAKPRASHPVPSDSSSRAISVPSPSRGAIEKIPLKGIRKVIAESMTRSKHTAAHFTYVEEVDMSAIVELKKRTKPEAEQRHTKLTYLPFIIKALIPVLKEFPLMNASLDDEAQEIVVKGDYNIGVATDTEQGLMVPVVKEADRKNVWEIAAEIEDLSTRCRTGKIKVDELRGGTFTVTNAGSIGGLFATPVINHPEVAILGVNAIRKRPVVKDDEIKIADIMYLSLSVDHRVVDGADAARFMNRLIYFLTDPMRFVFA